jgi:hypothetical protein
MAEISSSQMGVAIPDGPGGIESREKIAFHSLQENERRRRTLTPGVRERSGLEGDDAALIHLCDTTHTTGSKSKGDPPHPPVQSIIWAAESHRAE